MFYSPPNLIADVESVLGKLGIEFWNAKTLSGDNLITNGTFSYDLVEDSGVWSDDIAMVGSHSLKMVATGGHIILQADPQVGRGSTVPRVRAWANIPGRVLGPESGI